MKPLKRLTFLLFMLLTCPVDAAQFAEGVEVRTLFQRKEHGYNNVRIPAICATNSGTLLAFAEGREAGDAGKIDLILRRSEDQGKTWSEKILIWSDGENTCGNPCPVVDRDSGTVWLLCTWNIGSDHEDAIMAGKSAQPRRVFVLHSSDEGKTWFEPKPLPHLRENDWGWYATGPCNAIQLTRGVHKGRLVVPANHSLISDALKGPARYRSHLVFSDDFGKNWKLGPVNETLTNESTVLELEDGSLMQNMRSYHGKGGRAVSVGANGGDEMGPVRIDETLISPVCQGSVLRYRFREGEKPGIVLFSAPYGTKREKMSVWISYDDGNTWPKRLEIFDGPAAYSNLVTLPENRIGLLLEHGETGPYEKISFASFSLSLFEE